MVRAMVRPTLIFVAILTIAAVATRVALATPKDDWPRINGELWINTHDKDKRHTGTARNDELLGGHADDRIYGGRGHDVIWGDHKASGNTTHQNDTVYAGPGHDWVYASHGYNNIHGGGGQDTIRVWFGHGFVDCGPGDDDILYVSRTQNSKVRRKHCERVSHKSARKAIHDRDGNDP
jgi:Ca2+-binding RTX toxin-like protein